MSPEVHKLSPVGKDCCAEAAALLRHHREQARSEIEREVREECAALIEEASAEASRADDSGLPWCAPVALREIANRVRRGDR